jgi:hypothetical protein
MLIWLSACTTTTAAELIEVPAESQKGFEFPYVLFVAKQVEGGPPQYLLVEPNNTGVPDDNFEVHRAAAIRTARDSGVGHGVAKDLGLPLLVPVFPRPKSMENVYTHMLDRDTILIRDGALRRIDLQLIAMAGDAKRRLANLGRPVNDKLLITGFSASGQFASRFTFLHPNLVAAAAYGGLNSFIMVPVTAKQSKRLEFPLGLADYKDITGYSFDRAAYSRIPQLAYMGANDDNDAVLFDDGYPEPERSLVFELFGRKMMPDRWDAVQAIYQEQQLPVKFRIYPNIGHGTDRKIHADLADFFRSAVKQSP